LADVASERLGDAHHEALHLLEVMLADAGGAIHQEDDVCRRNVIASAWNTDTERRT